VLNKLLRIFVIFVGFFVGPGLVLLAGAVYESFAHTDISRQFNPFLLYILAGAASGIIFILLSGRIAGAIERGIQKVEGVLEEAPSATLLSGSIGLVIGLVIAALISIIIRLIPVAWLSAPLTVIEFIIFGYLGVSIGVKRRYDLQGFLSMRKGGKGEVKAGAAITPKILDTSVIIDGRIFDICKTGMFEGEILVPAFVLAELQHIADSSDGMKRTKGRRGLDIIGKMQKELKVPVRITDRDYDDITEVDAKLVRLAKETGGKVVTNDFNLNKVAAVQGVGVFNINELANAVKPVLVVGEELTVTIVKNGKEAKQGIAYLNDGTMIVVEGAKGRIDETLGVVVTSVLQTAAGRMIFARIK